MLGLKRMAMVWVGAMLAGCGPAAAPGAVGPDSDGTGGATGSTTDDETDEGGAPPATSGPPGGSTTGGDSSHDTDYPVEPGCDEGDEGWQEYDDSSGGEGSGGAEDSGIGMGGDFPLATSVYEIRTGLVPGGSFVQLTDVVVTAPAVLAPDGNETLLFVQEVDGGPNSGINLHIAETSAEIDALVPGDRVTLTGDFIERYVFAAIELVELTVGAHGAAPTPVVVTPDMVSAGAELAESLESVLVEIEQAEVVDPMACPGEVLVQATLKIDDRFLAADGVTLPTPESGVYTRVAGPLIYTYNGFEIAPRSLADLGF
jgi:hypothetical protein